MSTLIRPFKWFYHEFGLDAIHETGRNAYLIILARSFRMIAHGANSLILALFLSSLDFPDYQIGLFMTLTLVGDVILGGFLTLIADRSGRRNVLIGGSFLMIMSGCVFTFFDNFWILLTAAVLGVISTTGGDFGPFRSIEESILSHLTTPRTRADVLAWYVTTSTFGSALGSELSGRIVHDLQEKGWTLSGAYHMLFLSYAAMGVVNAILSCMLTAECELYKPEEVYSEIPQEESDEGVELPEMTDAKKPDVGTEKHWYHRLFARLSQISASTRKIMYKLWFLLAIDSLADGMVPYSLTNYYMELKFAPSKAALGDINGVAYLLGAISTVFAGPMARKIGLINTMVFTHVPSSAAVLLFPLPPNLVLTVILLFVRAGLNNMDQAPRSAFIAAVVKPEERTAAMGVTAIVRTLAATTGPTITGLLADNKRFWIAFVAAGACRLVYDIGLYVMFVNMKLHQHEAGPGEGEMVESSRLSDEEEITELDDLSQSNGKGVVEMEAQNDSSQIDQAPSLMPQSDPQVRRRSPSPLAKPLNGSR